MLLFLISPSCSGWLPSRLPSHICSPSGRWGVHTNRAWASGPQPPTRSPYQNMGILSSAPWIIEEGIQRQNPWSYQPKGHSKRQSCYYLDHKTNDSPSCDVVQPTKSASACMMPLHSDICFIICLNYAMTEDLHVYASVCLCVCVYFCRQLPHSTSSWADLEFRGFKVLTNDRAGDGAIRCMREQMHTCSNVCCLLMLKLRTQTNIFALCYLTMPVIKHMQRRLSKHARKMGMVLGGVLP